MLTANLVSSPIQVEPLPMTVRAQSPAIAVLTRFISAGPDEFRGAQHASLAGAPGAKKALAVAQGRRWIIAKYPTAAICVYVAFRVGDSKRRRLTRYSMPPAAASAHKRFLRIFGQPGQRPPLKILERRASTKVDRFSAPSEKIIAYGFRRCALR
jgi:hypothetical protein